MKRKSRALRASTIIPESLYVQREADRQLSDALEDMGRPPYVLVARQMGKTNLLLHMKRIQESAGDLVFYFDLSTRFSTASKFFRHVIDRVLEGTSVTPDVLARIDAERQNLEMEPHQEFDKHIRSILNTRPSTRFIIVLDEIDSLTTVPYSDSIFSQIRTMYFSRINYPEYANLTYVLSGVAEPADLIKDKNISPFNIGEKIYLNDFDLDELQSLLEKANLNLPDSVVERVFYWTRGNPRMCWDLCAELEEAALGEAELTDALVDERVNRLYTAAFDRPPVDHIRTLVESDPLLRDAVLSVRSGRYSSLTDRARSRLYLSGITAFLDAEKITFKNPVIDAALSESWLEEVANKARSPLEAAELYFDSGDYKRAAEFYLEYSRDHSESTLDPSQLAKLGISLFEIGEYQSSIEQLSRATDANFGEADRHYAQYALGASLLRSDQPADAIPHLRLASESPKQKIRWAALLVLGTCYVSSNATANYSEIIKINELLLSEISDQVASQPILAEIVASAHYNTALAHARNHRTEPARKEIERALGSAPVDLKPAISLFRFELERTLPEKAAVANSVADFIIHHKLRIVGNRASLSFGDDVIAMTLVRLLSVGNRAKFEELLEYASSELYNSGFTRFHLLLRLGTSAQTQGDKELYSDLVWEAIKDQHKVSSTKALFTALRFLAFYSRQRKAEAGDLYFNLFSERMTDEGVTDEDFLALFSIATQRNAGRDLTGAIAALDLALKFESKLLEDAPLYVLLFLQQKMELCRASNDTTEAKSIANKILSSFGNGDAERAIGRDYQTFLETALVNARKFLQTSLNDELRKLGRNQKVRVKDLGSGTVTTSKFKFVESALRSGKLELLGAVE